MKKLLSLMLAVTLVFSLAACGGSGETAEQSEGDISENNIVEASLVDVNKYSRISARELIDLMGEPDSIESWNNPTNRGTFLIKIYEYDGYAFFIADDSDSVVRMNIYSDKYYDLDAKGIEFTTEESIFDMLGIPTDGKKIKKVADTPYALRFTPVSDKVAEVWCIDIEDSTIGEIKVTFNLNYF